MSVSIEILFSQLFNQYVIDYYINIKVRHNLSTSRSKKKNILLHKSIKIQTTDKLRQRTGEDSIKTEE